MLGEVMTLIWGMAFVFALSLSILALVLRRWQLVIAAIPVSILLLFTSLSLVQQPVIIAYPALLFTAMILGLLGFLIYWPAMLKDLSEYLWQWLTLLALLILIVLNQVIFSSLWLFCLPAFTLCVAI